MLDLVCFVLGINPSTFVENFLANLLSTLLASVIIYLLIESRLTKINSERTIKNYFRNASSEFVANFIILERIIEQQEIILNTNKFPVARLEFKKIDDCISGNADILDRDDFNFFQSMIINFKSLNTLIDLVSYKSNQISILENKKSMVLQAPGLLEKVQKSLNILDKYNNKYNFIDPVKIKN